MGSSSASSDQNKVQIPTGTDHCIDPCCLTEGDHIYRRLLGVKRLVGYHHGVVTSVPCHRTDRTHEGRHCNCAKEIKVIEMTALYGIRESSLETFLQKFRCRLVYYNASKSTQLIHARGTCHVECSSTLDKIRDRIAIVKQHSFEQSKLYNLFTTNCEEFAIWIKTGLFQGAEYSQIEAVKKLRDDVAGRSLLNSAVTSAGTAANVARQVAKIGAEVLESEAADAVKTVVKAAWKEGNLASAGVRSARVTGSEAVENAVAQGSRTLGGAAAAAGSAVVIEAINSGYKYYKYKTDYSYTKCDLKRDLKRNWTVAIVSTAVGIALMPIGWWAILPAAAVGICMNFGFSHWNVWDKSLKEKLYTDFDLNAKSTKEEMKDVRRKILKMIHEEKLHPDQFRHSDLNDKKQQQKLEKFLWCRQFIEFLDDDISKGHVMFTETNQSSSPKAISV